MMQEQILAATIGISVALGVLFVGWLIQAGAFRRRRKIFKFYDGKKKRAIDPMIPFRSLGQNEKFDWEKTPLEMKASQQIGDIKLFFLSTGLTVDAVREAFQVEPFDQGGLTDFECVDLLLDFSIWINALKKNIKPSQTFTAPMASGTNGSTPKPNSASTSTAGASRDAAFSA
jgi:hypothetical protein